MNKKKNLSILARAARTLLIVMLLTMTAQTAGAQPFTITKVATPLGCGSIVAPDNSSGGTVNFTVTPNTGYMIKSVSVVKDGSYDNPTVEAPTTNDPTTTCSYSFSMPYGNVTITATFEGCIVGGKAWTGSGTTSDPYRISEVGNLTELANLVNSGTDFSGKYFKLMNDITFTHTTDWNNASTENNFTAIGFNILIIGNHPFKGTFDGDGHTISGIRIYKGGNTAGDRQQGLFGYVDGGTVKNLTLADARITGFENVGGIVGYNGGGTIENCHVLSNVAIHAVQSGADSHGGIVGYNSIGGTVSHCSSAATLTLGSGASGNGYGGIAGDSDGSLCDNLAIGVTIPAVNYRGAIAGYCGNLQRNYYSGCTVGDATSDIGAGYAMYDGTIIGDVTTNDGAVSAVILSESAAVPSPLSGKVVFRREFKQNVSSTICLPFGIDATQAAAAGKFFTFVGVDKTNPNDWIVTMQETAGNNMVEGALTANTPYLFKPAATGPVLFYGTAASTATAGKTPSSGHTDGWVFQGTYERINWSTDPQTIYGFAAPGKADLAEGKFFRVKGGSNSYILPFRAYLDAANGGASARGRRTPAESDLPDVMTVRLLSANGTPTAIGTLDTRTGEVRFDSDAWYSLGGRRLDGKPTKKGMYINKERKIIIK